MSANVDKMMYVGEVPWHGEGKKLDKVATSAEAIEAASLDWEVKKMPLFIEVNGQHEEVKGKFATVRSDRNKPLGVVGKVYTPLQNKEAFSFFDGIVGVKEAMYHTAGSLGDGEKVWILAKLPGYIQVKGDDVVDKYLLLANSHDGSSAVEMMFTPIRVVCQNTLNMAINASVGETSRVRHTRSLMVRVEEVREQLGIIKYQYDMFEQLSQKMANIQMNKEKFQNYLETIGAVRKQDEEEEMSTRTKNNLDTFFELFEHGKGNDLPGIKHTLWAGYNSVVEHVDYIRGSNKNRTKSLLYGSGADLKQRAWDKAVEWVA